MSSADRRRRWLQRALAAIGCACLGYYGYATLRAEWRQQQQLAALTSRLDTPPASAPAEAPPRPPIDVSGLPDAPNALAVLEIPRLRLVAPVLSGDDAETLAVGIGHLPDTPKPWEEGNSALAAHRDTIFRPLRRIRIGDEVRVRTLHGEFAYRVRNTLVVQPDDLSVLAPTSTPTLTLITCYPFDFVGHAPKRFIVHAERIEP